jgi:hypothetical protein
LEVGSGRFGSWKWEVWKLEAGGLEVGSGRFGSWKWEVWKLEVGSLEVGSGRFGSWKREVCFTRHYEDLVFFVILVGCFKSEVICLFDEDFFDFKRLQ